MLQIPAERREIRAAARLTLQELSNTAFTLRFALDRNDRLAARKQPRTRTSGIGITCCSRGTSRMPNGMRSRMGYGEGGGRRSCSSGRLQWRADAQEILIHVGGGDL